MTHSVHSRTIASSVQSPSCIWLFVTPWTAAHQACLSITSSWSLLSSCPLSQWCYPTTSSSAVLLSSFLQYFLASGSFLMSWLFASGGQSIGTSASVLIMNVQGWFPSGLTGCSPGDSQAFSSTTIQKHQFFGAQPSLWSSCRICTWLLEKPSLWLDGPLLAKGISAF